MRKSFAAFLNVLFFANCCLGPTGLAQGEIKSSGAPLRFVSTGLKENTGTRVSKDYEVSENFKGVIPAKTSDSQAGISISTDNSEVLPKKIFEIDLNVLNSNESVAKDSSQLEESKKKVRLYFIVDDVGLYKIFDVIYDPKFGQVLLNTSIDEFNKLGFEYGDSLDVFFSNGSALIDIPYYSGYSTRTSEPLLVGYHGNEHPALCRNNWYPLWNEASLKDKDRVVIRLNEKGKYLKTEEALRLKYSVDRKDFSSDEAFANFRATRGGNLKENLIYRSASPFDNRYKRIHHVDELAKKNKVEFLMNLADKEENVKKFIEENKIEGSYAASLYNSGRSVNLGMTCNYRSEGYANKVCCGLSKYIVYCKEKNNGKPVNFLIHCLEGKDRTGFIFVVLQMLCGASYDEMLSDYMKTYENYYGITRNSDQEKYEAIKDVKFDDYVDYLVTTYVGKESKGTKSTDAFAKAAEGYLKFGGMTGKQIAELKKLISK